MCHRAHATSNVALKALANTRATIGVIDSGNIAGLNRLTAFFRDLFDHFDLEVPFRHPRRGGWRTTKQDLTVQSVTGR